MFKTCLIALIAFLAAQPFSNAGHAIYKSVGNQTIYGNNAITRVVSRGFIVFDPDTNKATAVAGFTVNRLKLFSVVPIQNHRVERVLGPRGTTYTIIAKAQSPGTQFAGTLLEAVYMRGLNSSVIIDSQGSRSLPRTFVTSARGIVENSQTGVKAASEVTGSLTLDINASRASNLSESHDAAVTRLTNYFIGRGYTQFTPAPAS